MKNSYVNLSKVLLFALTIVFSFNVYAQVGGWKPELEADSKAEVAQMLEDTPKLNTFMQKAYGYAIYPKITKAGLGIGGAAGKGLVYRNGAIVGSSKLTQASFGFQAGGQQYSEIIFFENSESFEKFTNNKFKFGAQASAVAITAGGSIDAAYQDGVAVFTRVQGGLMYEASIGGQKFKFEGK